MKFSVINNYEQLKVFNILFQTYFSTSADQPFQYMAELYQNSLVNDSILEYSLFKDN